ncbi:MAG TPA: energy transducer TonB, partial [Bacteroidales bacterium]|nr:energy transducer TonB [Bacteroidales bacterium]
IAEAKKREEAEAERKRIAQETAERVRREEEQRRRDQISNRTKNAFGNAGNVGESGTSEGVAGGEGNQGVKTGTVGAPNYGPGGGPGNGTISYSLGNRGFQSLPVPKYDIQKEGVVVVEISVDRSGTVTKAVAGVKGSSTLDDDLLKVAHDAAMKAKFNRSDDAPLLQKGNITYSFKLN